MVPCESLINRCLVLKCALVPNDHVECRSDLAAVLVVVKGPQAGISTWCSAIAFQVAIVPANFGTYRDVSAGSPVQSAGERHVVATQKRCATGIELYGNRQTTVILVAEPLDADCRRNGVVTKIGRGSCREIL